MTSLSERIDQEVGAYAILVHHDRGTLRSLARAAAGAALERALATLEYHGSEAVLDEAQVRAMLKEVRG